MINTLFIYQLLLKKIIDLIGSWGGYEICYEQNENSKKWNSKDEGYWGYPSLYFKIDTIFNLVPDEIVDSIVNKDKTFGLYYLDFYKYLDLDQVYIPYENEEGLLFPFFQFLNLPIDIFTPPLKLIPKLFKYKIKDIILEGIIYQKVLKKEENIDEYLSNILNEVGLDKEILNKYPYELSGGQRQRVGIARAVAVKPDLIIADEILTALDALTQIQILELFQKLKENKKISYLFISHDINVVKKISDRLLIIKDGEIIESGTKEKIFSKPEKEYTKKLIEISGIR